MGKAIRTSTGEVYMDRTREWRALQERFGPRAAARERAARGERHPFFEPGWKIVRAAVWITIGFIAGLVVGAIQYGAL